MRTELPDMGLSSYPNLLAGGLRAWFTSSQLWEETLMKVVRLCAAAPFYVVASVLLSIGIGLMWIAAAIAGELRIEDPDPYAGEWFPDVR